MLIYCLMLFLVSVAVHQASRRDVGVIESRLFYFISFVCMVLVAGLRDRSVGTDTGSYVQTFAESGSLGGALATCRETLEFGFGLLNWVVRLLGDQYALLFFTIAIIVVACYQRAIIAHSVNVTLSFMVFICTGFYTFFLNGARQGIALAICSLAIKPMMERNFKKYLCLVLIAFTFHKSAMIMVPLYFMLDRKNTLKTNVIYWLIGCGSALALQKVVEVGASIDQRYAEYANAGEGGGYMVMAFSITITAFFLFFKKWVHFDRERYDFFLNMLLFGTMISVISVVLKIDPSGILRLAQYFNIAAVFLWPIVMANLRSRSGRLLVSYLLLIGYVAIFDLTTERFSNLVPYLFNPALTL